MKHLIAGLLALLLLTGCAPGMAQEAPSTPPEEAATTSPGLWEMGHPLEKATQGALRVYPLQKTKAYALFSMGEDLLVLSGQESTRLTRLSGEALAPTDQATLNHFLEPEAVTVTANGLSYYDPQHHQVVVLDASLEEIRHLPLPAEARGTPLLSPDQEALFYCTDAAVKAWDLSQNIHRTVTEMEKGQSLLGLYQGGRLLLCRTTDSLQLLSSENGRLLWQGQSLTLSASDSRFYCIFPEGAENRLVFGNEEGIQALTPAESQADTRFLPRQHAALSFCQVSPGRLRLDYYNLTTGRITACLPLSSPARLLDLEGTEGGFVYLLVEEGGSRAIWRWDPAFPAVNDGEVYTGPCYTAEDPDYRSLLALQARAAEIGKEYGLEILLWDDALACPPWDYDFESEYRISLLEDQLSQLEGWLRGFPEGFLAATAANFSSLKICLVRTITGTPESGSLACTDGIQYFSDTNAYIALRVGNSAEQAFYHELYHVMETQLLNNSTALDQWDNLNPAGFAYDYDYAANETRQVGSWLDADIRCFVDRYAMSFPKEDRARLFEYAMVPGSETLFAASPLQYKLKTLCQSIREAYGLKEYPEALPWEQYLLQSLAP